MTGYIFCSIRALIWIVCEQQNISSKTRDIIKFISHVSCQDCDSAKNEHNFYSVLKYEQIIFRAKLICILGMYGINVTVLPYFDKEL